MENKILDLTAPQRAILYTEKYYKNSTVNNICATEFIKEKVDFDILKNSVKLLVANNDIFNFILKFENGTMKQYISKRAFDDIEIVDLTGYDDVHVLENEMMSRTFNLDESNYFEFKLFRLNDFTGGVILNIHHLFADSWTLGLVANEIVRIYHCLILGQEVSFENSFSYLDYIDSEKKYINSENFIKDKTFWNSIFNTLPEQAFIPSDNYSNKLDFSCSANRLSFEINKDLMNKINDFCNLNNISVFNFFMAVYSLYIGKVSNTEDFVIGTPILNRTNFKQKHTMGMFINTVPMRINLSKNSDFKSFATDINTNFLSVLRHQKYSYQYILEDLSKNNNYVSNLYNILISYQITKANTEDGLDYETSWSFNGNCANDLNIHIYDINNTGSSTIAYDYKISKYNEKDISNLHYRILNIINQILENNCININDIDLICLNEKKQLIDRGISNLKNYDFKNNIIELIEDVAIDYPNRTAISFNNYSITYSELIDRVNKLANYLINSAKIMPKSNVGIFTSRNIDTIVGILAIIKINCTFVPIDDEYPIERINYMINNSLINNILYTTTNLNMNLNNNLNFISINYDVYKDFSNIINFNFDYDLNNNLYIIFTSGSTGNPKGVVLSHKNMMNLLFFEKDNTSIFKNDTVNKILQFATMSFDVSYQEIFSSFITGSTLVLISDSDRKNVNKLSNIILENNIDTLFIPPAYLKILVEDMNIVNKLSLTLKNIITAGEALILTDGIKKLLDLGIKIHNHYGPAETHVASTYTLNNCEISDSIPIGLPISNCNIYILNNYQKLCPAFCVGEIAISGICVGNGYFNNDISTAENFVQDIFNKNSKMYLTKDLGYMDYSGNFHYVGRKDFALKINGFRVELSEIDNVIIRYPGITSSASCVQLDGDIKHIITYYSGPSEIKEEILLDYLKTILPKYMLPKKIVFLNNLPLNNNGKIDRKLLPKVNLIDNYTNYQEVTTSTEKELQLIFKKLLNLKEIGANCNFFDIGGDSLVAIKLCSIILDRFNVDLEIKDVFDNPVLRDLANLIDNSKISTNLIKINKAPEMDYYPLSSAQKRIYYASLASPDPILYNISGGIIFDEILNIDKIRDCFNTIVKTHSSFRTCFKIINNEPQQIILNNVNLNIDLFYDDEINLNNIINNYSKEFNFENAPLLRVCVYYLNNKKTLILIDSHHIILDGTSLNILFNNFYNLYYKNIIEKPVLSYCDYSVWENNYIHSSNIKPLEEYWFNKFKNLEISPLNLPYTKISNQVSFNGNVISKKIDKNLFNKLEDFSKDLGVSNYMLFLASFYILLYKYTGQEDIIIGTPIANRNFKDAYNIIGMFINNIALYSKINENTSVEDFIFNIKNIVLESLNNQNYPYDLLIKNLNLKNVNLFDVMFIYQNIYDTNIPLDNIISAKKNTSKFNLSLEFIPSNCTLNLEYKTELFDFNIMNSLLDNFIHILELIVDNKSTKISDLCIITEKEKDLILNKFNNTYVDFPIYDISKKIEENALNFPNNTAIVFEDCKFTYDELNKKANEFANYLISIGVKNGDTVSIILNRSTNLIACILACLKLGVLYTLIDYTFPIDRINYIKENSNSKFIITAKNLFNSHFKNCIFIDELDLEKYNSNNLDITVSNDTPMCIIYTSGSTGTPKGVVLKRNSFVNLLFAFDLDMNISLYKNILSIANVGFDMFLVEIYSALFFGNSIILANEEEQKNPSKICALIKNNNVEFFVTTPSRVELLLSNNIASDCLKNVKAFQLGGEVFTPQLLFELKKYTNAKIYNGYGPTETTACSTNKLLDLNDVNIGKPISNVQIYICDKNLQLCPIGVTGEICIAGIGVSDGYINNETATNNCFVKNPFGEGSIYKTGDLGKYDFDGNIFYIGRNDNQIKLRGLRIELSEIENKLNNIDGITNSIVMCIDNSYLVGFYISKIPLDSSFIKDVLSRDLPTYMIPRKLIHLYEFPINNNGKIDKLNLQNLINNSSEETNIACVPPENNIQKLYCDIWSKLLGINVGIDDDLFEIGADSLLAIKFKIELLSHNIELSYADIFKYKTIRKLSENVKHVDSSLELANYDYDKINNLLDNSFIDSPLSYSDSQNVLLLGGNGFVGMHIINSFINNSSGKIYCIVRNKNDENAKNRFINVLHFYFGDTLDRFIDNRIIIIEGDILKENFGLSLKNYLELSVNVDTIINSAANVKHFGNIEKFNDININSLYGIISFCLKYNKRLIHISSLSVSGNTFLDGSINSFKNNDKLSFSEKDLYINQSLDNVYTESKFKAERLILDSIINNNLRAQILRLGNITSRFSDGKFQINPEENAFANRIKALINFKNLPDYILNSYIEFTPVDECANCIINILNNYYSKNYIYHIYNNNHIYFKDFIDMLNNYGFKISIISEKNFLDLVNNSLKQNDSNISNIINDFDDNKKLNYNSNIEINSDISREVLAKCGFKWNKIDYSYLKKYLDYLKSINYID